MVSRIQLPMFYVGIVYLLHISTSLCLSLIGDVRLIPAEIENEGFSTASISGLSPLRHFQTRVRANESQRNQMVRPEVLVVIDHKSTKRFSNNMTAIKDYIRVYFHGINLRFNTIQNPRIIFTIVGVHAVSSIKDQPYLETSRVGSIGCDISQVLEKFSSWIYRNVAVLPPHDIAHLITAEEMLTKETISNTWTTTINGLAYISGACWVSHQLQKSIATSVVQDSHGTWNGVFTSSHELAHNLGASHDGVGSGESCPQSDGYLMSYSGWGGRNKFYFSRCERKLIPISRSPRGECLSRETSVNTIDSYQSEAEEAPGERITMTELCKSYTSNRLAYVDPDISPSTLCKHLICRYPDGSNGYYILRTNHPPGDLSSCGNYSEVLSAYKYNV